MNKKLLWIIISLVVIVLLLVVLRKPRDRKRRGLQKVLWKRNFGSITETVTASGEPILK